MSSKTMTLKEIIAHYGQLSGKCIEELERASNLLHVKRGEILVEQGKMCNAFFFNSSGLMRVVLKKDDMEDTFMFGSTGDIYTTLHSWFADLPSPFSLIAVEDSEVYEISYHSIRRLLKQYPDLTEWFLKLCFGQLYALERRYLMYATSTAEERLRNFLAKDEPILERVPVKTMAQGVPLKQIASYLKMTPETLSRLRRKIIENDR